MIRRLINQQTFKRTLFIQTELTPNTNSIKFKPGKTLMNDSKTMEFLNKREAMVSLKSSS